MSPGFHSDWNNSYLDFNYQSPKHLISGVLFLCELNS